MSSVQVDLNSFFLLTTFFFETQMSYLRFFFKAHRKHKRLAPVCHVIVCPDCTLLPRPPPLLTQSAEQSVTVSPTSPSKPTTQQPPVFCVELKPKQGFLSMGHQHCPFCLNQFLKVYSFFSSALALGTVFSPAPNTVLFFFFFGLWLWSSCVVLTPSSPTHKRPTHTTYSWIIKWQRERCHCFWLLTFGFSLNLIKKCFICDDVGALVF